MNKYYNLINKAEEESAELYIEGEIVDEGWEREFLQEWFGEKATASSEFTEMLKTLNNKPLKIHCNSVGGSLFAGTAMYAALTEYKGKKIGFCSQGDPAPYNNQCSILEGLINEGCDIVVCASRTKGETVNLITRLFDEVIWVHNLCVEPYEGNEGVAEEMNILSAKSIIKLLG